MIFGIGTTNINLVTCVVVFLIRIRKFDHSKSDGEGEGTAESGLSVGFGRM